MTQPRTKLRRDELHSRGRTPYGAQDILGTRTSAQVQKAEAKEAAQTEKEPCCARNPVAGHDGFSAID